MKRRQFTVSELPKELPTMAGDNVATLWACYRDHRNATPGPTFETVAADFQKTGEDAGIDPATVEAYFGAFIQYLKRYWLAKTKEIFEQMQLEGTPPQMPADMPICPHHAPTHAELAPAYIEILAIRARTEKIGDQLLTMLGLIKP